MDRNSSGCWLRDFFLEGVLEGVLEASILTCGYHTWVLLPESTDCPFGTGDVARYLLHHLI